MVALAAGSTSLYPTMAGFDSSSTTLRLRWDPSQLQYGTSYLLVVQSQYFVTLQNSTVFFQLGAVAGQHKYNIQ